MDLIESSETSTKHNLAPLHIEPLKMDLADGSETSAKHTLDAPHRAFKGGPDTGFPNIDKTQSDAAPHRAFEDGPDRWFRNVGKTKSDVGEIPKRTYTTFALLARDSNCNQINPHQVYKLLFQVL
jgi:hypothetical protein